MSGKNPFAEYYDLTLDNELIHAKAQADKAAEHNRALQAIQEKRIDKLEKENEELQTRLEAIEKEEAKTIKSVIVSKHH